jgi:hypothetical protein
MSLITNLVSYWNMDAVSAASQRLDRMSNNDLSVVGTDVPIVAGFYGNASEFQLGNTKYLQKTNSSTLHIPGDVTISAWVKVPAHNTNLQYLLSRDGEFALRVITGSAPAGVQFRFDITRTGGLQGLTTALQYSLNAYHHVVARYNFATKTQYLTVDGANTVSVSAATDPLIRADGFGAGFIVSGNNAGSGTGMFVLDEVAFWSRFLPDTEVGDLYNGGSGTTFDDWGGVIRVEKTEAADTLSAAISQGRVLQFLMSEAGDSLLSSVDLAAAGTAWPPVAAALLEKPSHGDAKNRLLQKIVHNLYRQRGGEARKPGDTDQELLRKALTNFQ